MPKKRRSKRRIPKKSDLEVNMDAITVLRTVNNEEAFYFYEALEKPTGQSAKSLSDFLEKTQSVRLESLQFHIQRKDFQNWFRRTLGDPELAERIEKIPWTDCNKLKSKIQTMIKRRIEELAKTPVTLVVSKELVTPMQR
jgi:hypothetical protein